MSFFDFTPKDFKGDEFPFKNHKGKVTLVVNVASKCHLAPQYRELEDLNRKYAGKNVQIVAFPCNQFGKQEPGSAVEIITFCSMNYGVTFPVLGKIKVNGKNADPVYKFLKSKKPGFMGLKRVNWNFEKFLIDQNGQVAHRYSALTRPHKLGPKIDELLRSQSAT
ncbi:hypothetical protein OXX59_000959 [Metschnikowia pulcherrima]